MMTGMSHNFSFVRGKKSFYSLRGRGQRGSEGSVWPRVKCEAHEVCLNYTLFIRRMQSLGLYSRLLKPVSDHVLTDRVSKEQALHQVIKYSSGAI